MIKPSLFKHVKTFGVYTSGLSKTNMFQICLISSNVTWEKEDSKLLLHFFGY